MAGRRHRLVRSRKAAGFSQERLARAAEPDNAASAGYEALTVAVETHSLRTIDELKRVSNLLAPWRSQPAVCELREAVSLLSGD